MTAKKLGLLPAPKLGVKYLMKISCLNCNHKEFEAYKVFFSGSARSEFSCTKCGSTHRFNMARLVVSLLVAGVIMLMVSIRIPAIR